MSDLRGLSPDFWTVSVQAIAPTVVYSGTFPSRPADYYGLCEPNHRVSYVYILTNAADEVLYVGMSVRPGNRFDRHRRLDWWPEVDGLTLLRVEGADRLEARAMALFVELRAIRKLRPTYNIAGVIR